MFDVNSNFVLQTRSRIGLFDLNKFSEDFIKDLLNKTYDYNLTNLNDTRSNEPGLDLGDEVQKLGIQVTTDKRSTKINHTLERITDEQRKRYERFIVLILGAKQTSYDGINAELATDLSFDPKNDIWDFSDLERTIVSLPVEKLKDVYDILQNNLMRVFSDMDVGTTPSGESTSMLEVFEQRPANQYTGCSTLVEHINKSMVLL